MKHTAFIAAPFLKKPVSVDNVRNALAHLRYPIADKEDTQKKLRVVTFGNFKVYADDGKTLKFSRSLSREIFAYLIDQCGFPVTSKMIAADVLEVQDFDDTTSKKPSKTIGYLVSDLSSAGFTDMIDKQNSQIRINKKDIL